MQKQAWQIEIETAIKARDFASAQRGVDDVLFREPDNKAAHILQEELLVRRTQEDEKSPVTFQGTQAQFVWFALGLILFGQPFVTVCIVLYNRLILHHTGLIAYGYSRAGDLGPISHVSPWTIILGSSVDLCLGAWLMKTAYNSWNNS